MINALKANIINETQKLLLKKKSLALLIFSAAIPVMSLILVSYFQTGLGINPVRAADFPITVLGYFTGIFLPLFIVMAAVDSFSGELGEKTLKAVLLRPISRFKVYLSKIAALGIYAAVYLAFVYILSTVSGAFLEGKEDILSAMPGNLVAYAAALVPMLLTGIMVAFIAQFFKNSSGAFIVSVLLYIVLKFSAVFVTGISRLSPISYNDWHLMWLDGNISASRLLTAFAIMLSYIIIFFSSGFYLFDRREL